MANIVLTFYDLTELVVPNNNCFLLRLWLINKSLTFLPYFITTDFCYFLNVFTFIAIEPTIYCINNKFRCSARLT